MILVGCFYAGALALAIEIAQVLMPSKIADTTEVALCVIGTLIGLLITRQILASRLEERRLAPEKPRTQHDPHPRQRRIRKDETRYKVRRDRTEESACEIPAPISREPASDVAEFANSHPEHRHVEQKTRQTHFGEHFDKAVVRVVHVTAGHVRRGKCSKLPGPTPKSQ